MKYTSGIGQKHFPSCLSGSKSPIKMVPGDTVPTLASVISKLFGPNLAQTLYTGTPMAPTRIETFGLIEPEL
jgi:hypothetical protein